MTFSFSLPSPTSLLELPNNTVIPVPRVYKMSQHSATTIHVSAEIWLAEPNNKLPTTMKYYKKIATVISEEIKKIDQVQPWLS